MIKARPDSNGDLRGVATDGFYVEGDETFVALVLPYGQIRLSTATAKQLVADLQKVLHQFDPTIASQITHVRSALLTCTANMKHIVSRRAQEPVSHSKAELTAITGALGVIADATNEIEKANV